MQLFSSAANQIREKRTKVAKRDSMSSFRCLCMLCVFLKYKAKQSICAPTYTVPCSSAGNTQIRPAALFHAADTAIVNHTKGASIHLRRSSLSQTKRKCNSHICQLSWHSWEIVQKQCGTDTSACMKIIKKGAGEVRSIEL